MRTLTLAALLSLVLPVSAGAAQAVLSWEARPAAEQIQVYQVWEGQTKLWEGQGTTATVQLTPGPHVLTGRACNMWGCSGDSSHASTPPAAQPPGAFVVRVLVEVIPQ